MTTLALQARNNTTMAGLALDSIRGGQEAQRLVHRLQQGVGGCDELLDAMKATFATGNEAVCQGFCRELSKRLERAA